MPNLACQMRYNDFAAQHPEFIAEKCAAKLRADDLLAQLAASRTSRDRQRLLIRRLLLGDFATRLYFSYEGIRRAGRFAEYDPASIRQMAAELNVFAPLNEPVETRVVRRGTKDRRIFSFRPRSRARQLLVAAVLKAIHGPFPNQHTVGGGVPAALKAVEQAVHEGHVCGRELDIQDFYPSMPFEPLVTSLHRLPRPVVENTVWMGNAVPLVNPDGSLHGVDDAGLLSVRGLRGLPQGSACSTIAAEKFVADVIAALPSGSRAVAYADNIMLLGETEHDVEQATMALVAELDTRSAGSLTLKAPFSNIYNARSETIRFLGHEGEMVTGENGARLTWQPEYGARERFETLVECQTSSREELIHAMRRVRQWRRAYPSWENGSTWATTMLAQLKAKLAYQSSDINMRRLATEIAVHWRDLDHVLGVDELLPEVDEQNETKRSALRTLLLERRQHIRPPRVTTLSRTNQVSLEG